jgi:hypothetical protein
MLVLLFLTAPLPTRSPLRAVLLLPYIKTYKLADANCSAVYVGDSATLSYLQLLRMMVEVSRGHLLSPLILEGIV